MEGGRFELPNPKERIYSPPRLATSLSLRFIKWLGTESNRRHFELQSNALPTELPSHTVPTGFEPAISCVTGRHVNPYTTEPVWRLTGSNRWPSACKADALPAELNLHVYSLMIRTGFEPVLPPWKGGVLTTWPTDLLFIFSSILYGE